MDLTHIMAIIGAALSGLGLNGVSLYAATSLLVSLMLHLAVVIIGTLVCFLEGLLYRHRISGWLSLSKTV